MNSVQKFILGVLAGVAVCLIVSIFTEPSRASLVLDAMGDAKIDEICISVIDSPRDVAFQAFKSEYKQGWSNAPSATAVFNEAMSRCR
jgi:hypothetical protein